jgi:hypothetical protein
MFSATKPLLNKPTKKKQKTRAFGYIGPTSIIQDNQP